MDKETKQIDLEITPKVNSAAFKNIETKINNLEKKIKNLQSKANKNTSNIDSKISSYEQKINSYRTLYGERRVTLDLAATLKKEILNQSLYTHEQKRNSDVKAAQDKVMLKIMQAEDLKKININKAKELADVNFTRLYDKFEVDENRDINKHQRKLEVMNKRASMTQGAHENKIEELNLKHMQKMEQMMKSMENSTKSAMQKMEQSTLNTMNKLKLSAAKVEETEAKIKLEKTKQETAITKTSEKIRYAKEMKLLTSEKKKQSEDKDKKTNRPYENSPFRRLMMYLGSGMLIQYAVWMVGNTISRMTKYFTGLAAQTEISALTGKYYREGLANPENFDKTVSRYAQMSGMAEYETRGILARTFGELKNRKINANSLNPEKVASVLRGIQYMNASTVEQANDEFIRLLSGQIGKEERRKYGITSRRNPVKILDEILNTLKENPAARVGLGGLTLQDRIQQMQSRPARMMELINTTFPSIFKGIVNAGDRFMKAFFPSDKSELASKWAAMFEELNRLVNNIPLEFIGETLASLILDTIGIIAATINAGISVIKDLIDKVKKFKHWMDTEFAPVKEKADYNKYWYDKAVESGITNPEEILEYINTNTGRYGTVEEYLYDRAKNIPQTVAQNSPSYDKGWAIQNVGTINVNTNGASYDVMMNGMEVSY